jgi:hypothetical protein
MVTASPCFTADDFRRARLSLRAQVKRLHTPLHVLQSKSDAAAPDEVNRALLECPRDHRNG